MTELRAHLREYIAKCRAGEEVVVTERGVPVARLVGIDKERELIERLTREGVLAPPLSPKKRRATRKGMPRSKQPVSDLISEMRR